MTIFEWVYFKLSSIHSFDNKIINPSQLLEEAGAPKDLFELFNKIEDKEFPLKKCFDGEVPDLESRERVQKRKSGQYYTPESFADRLVKELINNGKAEKNLSILDPSCGDGSFLLAAAKYLNLDYIYGYDIDVYALLVSAVRLVALYPGRGWPKLKKCNYLLEENKDKFDIIVGNPPYRVNLDDLTKSKLEKKYITTEGEKDLYTFFLEESLNRLNPEGCLVMLTSHTWLVNHQCKKIRKYIFENSQVSGVYMLPARFFASAPGVLPIVLFAEKRVLEDNYEVNVFTDYAEKTGWKSRFSASSSKFIDGNGLRNSIIPEELSPVFKEMEKSHITFGDVCRIGVGIQESIKKEGASSKYVVDKALNSNYKPVLKGREIAAFKVCWGKKYIHYGSHLAYAGDENLYLSPKILYQNIRNEKLTIRLVAAVDDEGFYPKNSLSFILSNNVDYSLELIVGLMNSLLVNSWFSSNNHSFHITVTQVRKIPLPPINKVLFKEIEKISRKLKTLKQDTSVWKKYFDELNILVIRCYLGKIDNEQGFLDSLRKFLEEAARL